MVTQNDIDKMSWKILSEELIGTSFINGTYVTDVQSWIECTNPSSGRVYGKIQSGTTKDVDYAVKCAREKTNQWGVLTSPKERREILLRFANLIEENALELSVIDTIESGKPIKDNIEGDLPETIDCFRYHAEAINKIYDKVSPTDSEHVSMVVREPVGVVGLIVPWNFPLLMAAWKLAPALATGNCVVIKPSEMTSQSLLLLGALANDAGIPPGVLNIVTGYGNTVGESITCHMDIDMVGFTGSTNVGRKVLINGAQSNMKRVSLECGGKSPQIVFDDSVEYIDKVADQVVSAAFWNQGQNCSCGSRLIVQRGIKDKLVSKLIQMTGKWKVGDPLELDTQIGSMISSSHCDKIMDYMQIGINEGARLLTGGTRIHGNFISLTIFDNVTNNMTIAQEEIFGPCLSIIEFDTEDEAIQIANDTIYGLAASLYTPDINRVHRISQVLKSGTISVNCFGEGDETTPFGGYKQSGFVGRDKSIMAHDQYQEIKTIWIELF